MLNPMSKSDTSMLTICLTCRDNSGQALHDLIAAENPDDGIQLEGYDCLWSCAAACSVQLKETGKIGYHMGGFLPRADQARAILEFAGKYHASATGEVDYQDWPEAIRGHFIARIPPLQSF
ncbi:DUF1636 domain-containing protein [Paremcibacter congregatus]|uniref:DUF1636 domain-containing protein n=1 Tax=Paremcibacter congregatus TaxID=2043170 RepID=UPI0030EDBFD0|tara:strand:+ start:543 stop:905 length:363 start_codon:yes stop_codon:yes gene_type:complete